MDGDKYLKALVDGNQAITREVYEKFYPKVHTFILRNNGESADAKTFFRMLYFT